MSAKTGPGEVILMRMAVTIIIGENNIRRKIAENISINLLENSKRK
jgi:hypothetical protein